MHATATTMQAAETPASRPTLAADFSALVSEPGFMRAMLVHFVNHRVQDFQDPLTSTLILMVTSPMQLHFCEAGLLLFKSHALPVFPFDRLTPAQRESLRGLVERAGVQGCSESFFGCGKYTVQVHLGAPTPPLAKRQVLLTFVAAMTVRDSADGPLVMRRLCDIVLQRFLSSVVVPSSDIRAVTDLLWERGGEPQQRQRLQLCNS